MGKKWVEYKVEHLFYFNEPTLGSALNKSRYNELVFSPDVKILSLRYIFQHFFKFPVPGLTPLIAMANKILPNFILDKKLRIVASGLCALGKKM